MPIALLSTVLAFVIWGLLPIFWKSLQGVPALEILSQRMVWALLFLLLLLAYKGRWRWLGPALRSPRLLGLTGLCSLLLALNWGTYIWAVNSGHLVETSLGYYINPLVNVLLGTLILKERLRPLQWLAIAIAASGVLYMTLSYGRPPWIALTLGFSFGFYGLLRKGSSLGALEGLSLETALLTLPALLFLLTLAAAGLGHMGQGTIGTDLLLAATGIATALPLLLFGIGARALPLSTVGLLQYIAPTIQLLLGIWLYQEPFEASQRWGFGMIWAALLLYSLEGLFNHRQTRRRARSG